jgi:hypothetical protein
MEVRILEENGSCETKMGGFVATGRRKAGTGELQQVQPSDSDVFVKADLVGHSGYPVAAFFCPVLFVFVPRCQRSTGALMQPAGFQTELSCANVLYQIKTRTGKDY